MRQITALKILVASTALASLACSIALPSLPFGPDIGIGVPPQVNLGPEQTEAIDIPAVGSPVNLHIQFAAGKLLLTGGGQGMVSGSATYNVAELKPVVEGSGDDWSVRTGNLEEFSAVGAAQLVNTWDLELGADPFDLSFEIGAAKAEMDLGDVSVTRLEMNSGASDVDLTFSTPNPAAMESFTLNAGAAQLDFRQLANANATRMDLNIGGGDVTLDFSGELSRDLVVSISGAAGNYTLYVPEGTAARFSRSGGFIAVNAGEGWTPSGDDYVHGGDGLEIRISVTAGAGNVNLRTN